MKVWCGVEPAVFQDDLSPGLAFKNFVLSLVMMKL